MTKQTIDDCLRDKGVIVEPNREEKTCNNFIRTQIGNLTSISIAKYNELVADANNLGMTKQTIDDCLRDKGVIVEPNREEKTCNNFIRTQIGNLTSISIAKYNELVADANNLGMTKQTIDDCLRDKGVIVEPNREEKTCNNFIRTQIGNLKNITRAKYDELVADANNLGMTQQTIDDCLRKNGVTVDPAPATAATATATPSPAVVTAAAGTSSNLFNVWVEPTSGRPLEYKPIKCDDDTFENNNKCENFIKAFVNGSRQVKHEYIKQIATGGVPDIKNLNKVHPQIALSFLGSLGFKKKKQIDDKIHKIVYNVEPYDEWAKRITEQNKKTEDNRDTYAENGNVKKFINDLINILNNNLVFINKHLSYELIPDTRGLYDEKVGVDKIRPNVPKEWQKKGLRQEDTNRWYESFITKIRNDWKNETAKFEKEKNLETSVYGRKVNLINDEPREGVLYFFNSIYPGYFAGGGKNIEKELGSKWSNIKNILSQKKLKLMGNVDINEKLKEYGEINKQKDDLLKIMSDYGKFINSSKLNSSKDMSLLVGGYQELLSKEEQTSEYLNKKLYVINELLNHVN